MDRFVVRGISADDAAENLLRQLDQHDEMLHQRALDCQDAAVEKRGPGRPRKLSSIGLLLARDPAASPSTPPPPSRSSRSHENWWHPASIRPILQAVPACGGYSPAIKHLKLIQPETYNKLRESTVRGWFLKGSLTQLTAEAQASLLRGFGHHHPPTAGRRATLIKYGGLQLLQVFEDEQNADAVEDDAAVQANDLEAALLARPAHKPLPGMMVPMEDSPLLTEQVVGMDVQSMTAVELMVATQQWSAITRAMPAAKPSAKPAAATADGPPMRKRGRPLGSKNKPKPAKQARLVCDTSSSANSSNANTSSDSNSSGDNSSSDDGSANNEGWVVGPTKSAVGVVGRAGAAAGVAGCTRSAARVAGEARAAAREAGRTKSATGMASLTEQIKKVQERIKEAEDRVQFLKALPVRNEYESVCLVETEKRLIIFRKEEAILSKEGSSIARHGASAQPSPAQPSPAQPSPAQPSPAQPSPAQPSPTMLFCLRAGLAAIQDVMCASYNTC
ncbi:hypothetical protein V8C86DRAFT_3033685 [Haematococcus lacustris]